ncbi:MAG: hypothetical protein V3S21_05110 [Xanthomonadales bacterium]
MDQKFYRVVGAGRESKRPQILAAMPDGGARGWRCFMLCNTTNMRGAQRSPQTRPSIASLCWPLVLMWCCCRFVTQQQKPPICWPQTARHARHESGDDERHPGRH